MPVEWLVVALLVIVAGALLVRSRRTQRALPPAAPTPVAPVTPATLEPGDVVTFWDEHTAIVATVLECAEELHGRVTRWRWVLLDDGRVLQAAGEALTLFERGLVIQQGAPIFARLTAPLEAGGILQQFEARVRAGTVGLEPVRWEYEGGEHELRSTGTFQGTWRGAPLGPVWADIAADATQNVYATFEGRGGAVDGLAGLAVWTSHILLLFGRPLHAADLLGCYRGGDTSRSGR